jgi:hypothetical protein
MNCYDVLLVSTWCSGLPLKSDIHYWPMINHRCVLCSEFCPWVFIATHWMVTNWSNLEACLRSVRWLKVRADLNRLKHLEIISSNNWRSSTVIRTSDLLDSGGGGGLLPYQLCRLPCPTSNLYILWLSKQTNIVHQLSTLFWDKWRNGIASILQATTHFGAIIWISLLWNYKQRKPSFKMLNKLVTLKTDVNHII